MKDYEKQIEEAANKHIESREHKDSSRYSFLYGVKSPEAKEFHQQGMYTEEEVKEILESFQWYAKDNCEANYLDEETAEIVFGYDYNFEEWFGQNKKK